MLQQVRYRVKCTTGGLAVSLQLLLELHMLGKWVTMHIEYRWAVWLTVVSLHALPWPYYSQNCAC
jgi:hypothetical protein